MRNAETILGIIRERGKKGLPLFDVYRQLFNPNLFLLAYAKISKNHGAMTPGATKETVDGMSLTRINAIIEAIRLERYRFSPVRRVYIEKKGSTKTRPLGLPTFSDKLLQEVIRLVLEAYYEPRFSKHSHGFRPKRGCHTALLEIQRTWRGTAWFVEGDIKGCFDNLDHAFLMGTLKERILDNRFLRLIEGLLKAGYLEEWRYYGTFSGTPQGGVCSPILANIYLDRLDKFVEDTLIPEFTFGDSRERNTEYERILSRATYLQRMGRLEEAKLLRQEMRSIPSRNTNDPNYCRLRYVRYADDFLLGVTGPREDAERIKAKLKTFLHEKLKLELSLEKTLISHARTEPARFLGYNILTQHNDSYRAKDGKRVNGNIGLHVPLEVVKARCAKYMRSGRPTNRPALLRDSEYAILSQYQYEFRGFANYYELANDRSVKLRRLKYVMECSLTQTLANKLRIAVGRVYDRFGTMLRTPDGVYKGLQVKVAREGKTPLVATWGGISLARPKDAKSVKITDSVKPDYPFDNELLTRLLKNECELCGSRENIQVHHVRHLRDLNVRGQRAKPEWMVRMAARQRKTLVVCHACHVRIHHGLWDGTVLKG